MLNTTINPNLLNILQTKFNFNTFRPGQLEAITTLLEHGRLLCLQPTGHGKSLLYQLPASLLDGITIVISPLLALMRDQIGQLNNRFNIPAATINTDQSDEENYLAQKATLQNKIKILFIAPEKLDHIDYFEFLLNLNISLIVVDEAHCISTWGHDFRPSYRQIIHFIRAAEQKNNELKVLAITATANEKTETDIKQQLANTGHEIPVQRHSMDRGNIQLSVIQTFGVAEKLFLVAHLLKQLPGNGLIYCATRENTELVAEYLENKDISSAAYHAGFIAAEKRILQDNFIANKYKVIAATNALGMGIDKQDLRFIIHFDVPGSITAYYQEVGRCGRDGQTAQGILLFDEMDKKIQEYFINSAQPSRQDFQQIINCIATATYPPGLTEIKRSSGLHPTQVNTIIAELVEQKFISKKSQDRKQIYCLMQKQGQPDLARYQNQFEARTHELNEMVHYGKQAEKCLMSLLRNALGDLDAPSCGHCSICKKSPQISINKHEITEIKKWLSEKVSIIEASTKNSLSAGTAILNAQLRSPIFIRFMKERTTEDFSDHELLELIKHHLTKLKTKYIFGSVIPIPSRTWSSRDHATQFIADFLNVPSLIDFLQWRQIPSARQGELLNNDQRRHNVHQHMQTDIQNKIPRGAILLLDDYTGSGATLHEAARVLSKQTKINNEIIPFTLASVKWRLGKRGMI